MDEAGVKGAYLDNDEGNDGQQNGQQNGNGSRKYFRVLRSVDISSPEHSKTVKNVVEQVFNSLATRVVVESKPAEGSDLESYIEELKESL